MVANPLVIGIGFDSKAVIELSADLDGLFGVVGWNELGEDSRRWYFVLALKAYFACLFHIEVRNILRNN